MASVTFIQPGSNRGVTGQTVEAFWNSISHVPLLSVGMNCALGPKEMRPLIEELAQIAPIYISTHPNAGLPDPLLPTGFPETPESLAPQLREWADNGWLNIVGGCCGTTPAHIRRIAEAVNGLAPRALPQVEPFLRLSGLESLTVRPESNFVNIGERTNVTGSPVFAKLVLAGDYEKAVSVARQQVEGGAQIIDVNMDEGMLDSKAAMEKFLRLIAGESDIARVPVMVDSSKWEVIEAGLQVLAGQRHRQFDQLERRRREIYRPSETDPPLRRRGHRHGLRRARPGGYLRTEDRGVRAHLQDSNRASRIPAPGNYFRSEYSHRRHRHRGA